MYSNFLNGSIPASIGDLVDLFTLYEFPECSPLDLSWERISSRRNPLPEFLFSEEKLLILSFCRDLSYNRLEGDIPQELGKLRRLKNLYRPLSLTRDGFSCIHFLVELNRYLQDNHLSGTISSSWLTNLTDLQLLYAALMTFSLVHRHSFGCPQVSLR